MKLAIVNHNLGSGGAEKLIYDLSLKIKEIKGIELTIILLTKTGGIYDKILLEKGVKIIYLNEEKKIYSINNIYKLIKILENFDIIHTHTFPAQFWTACASLFVKKKKCYITTEHSTNNNRRNKKIFKIVDKWMYSKYNKIISINKVVEEELKKWIGKKYNFKIIENGVDLEKISKIKSYSKEKFGYSKTDKLVCMTARLIKMKTHETLINAIEKLPQNYKCIFLGEGSYRNKLERIVEQKGLKERISFLGYREDVIEIVKMCDLSILTSKYEGLPLSVIESMYIQPFIGSDVLGIKELVHDAGILFEYENVNELVEKIRRTLEDENYYEFIKKRCLEKAKKFDIKSTVNNYLDEYQNLMKFLKR